MTKDKLIAVTLSANCTSKQNKDPRTCPCWSCDYVRNARYEHMCGANSIAIKRCCKYIPYKEKKK